MFIIRIDLSGTGGEVFARDKSVIDIEPLWIISGAIVTLPAACSGSSAVGESDVAYLIAPRPKKKVK